MKQWPFMSVIGLGLLLGGCNDPAHQRLLAQRQQNLQKTVRIFEQNESGRTENLGRTLAMLKRQHDRDVENSERNPGIIAEWFKRDVDNWNERQPAYRKGIHDQLKGNPESIKRTVPYMLY